jgi:steroid 5-alpha reductase family enzyme
MNNLASWFPLLAVAISSVLMMGLWVLERRWQNASHVDAGWSAGIGLLAVLAAIIGPGDPIRRVVVAFLAGLWSLRLTIHLIRDRLGNRPEDGRYAMLREQWAPHAGRWFFAFFQLQAGFVVIFSLPSWVATQVQRPFGTVWDMIAIGWFAGCLVATVSADRQLARWRSDPNHHGKTCRAGWWRYSRHPNYFFEFLGWWCWPLLAIGGTPWWVTIAVPLFLLALLLGVTGIPYNEKRAVLSRGEDYRIYQREVSSFIPWFPRRTTKEVSP